MEEELRIVDRERGTRIGSLQNHKQGRFRGCAQFSPSGKLVFTAASNSRLQLWRAPATAEETQFFRQGYLSGFDRRSLLPVAAIGSPWSFGAFTSLASRPTAAPMLWQLSGQEVRHFVVPGSTMVQCAAFAPDESVVFTGGTDKTVRVWAVPKTQQWNQPLEARITYVGSQVERGTDMVRIRAELDNPSDPGRRLRAGLFAVMRLFPETATLIQDSRP
jgi:WD40 repeat protein